MFKQRFMINLDKTLVAVVASILFISMVVIASSTMHVNATLDERYWYLQRQGFFIVFNVFLIVLIQQLDYREWKKFVMPLYILNLVMLLLVMFVGQTALGAQRWIQIGPVNLQPSEFSKVIMILALAHFLDKNMESLNSWQTLLKIVALVGIPFVLVLKQPDLGTALVFIAITLGMIFAAGIRLRYLMIIATAVIVIMPIFWHFLKDYQKMRLLVFLDPNIDPLGSGYHIIQSKIAIGSGMLFGKGIFQGTQSQLNFLPENHTDFIFAVVGEEFGFLGAVILLLLFLVLLYRIVRIAGEACDNFGMLLAIGVGSMVAFHLLVNIGMTTGIMPVTGIPLPMVSYGVSSLTTNLISIGILLNVYSKRKNLRFN